MHSSARLATALAILTAGCGTVDSPAGEMPADGGVDGGTVDGASDPGAAPPKRIRFSDDVVDPGEAGHDGPGPFRDDCPQGQAVISMTGAFGSIPGTTVVGKLRAHCGIPTLVASDGEVRVTTQIGDALLEHGMGEDVGPWSRPCKEGEFVIGFAGRAGDRLDQLIVRCAALRLELRAGAWAPVRGPISALVPAGPAGGAPFDPVDCPDGQVATSITGRVEIQLAGFGVICRQALVD